MRRGPRSQRGTTDGGAGGNDAGCRSSTTITVAGEQSPAAHSFIQLDGVRKTYRGLRRRVEAVADVSFHIRRGEVFGLAGPNGAGKSTLIALLLGFLEPTTGEVRIDGLRPRQFVERRGVGYLSELVTIPPRWRLEEALSRYALLAGIARPRQRVAEIVELLGLSEHWGKQIRQLSKGNLQRVGLGQALLHDEELLILDEPTHGLDPVWTQRFREIVTSLRNDSRAILIASHNLDELQRVADRVAIIDHGRLQRVVATRAVAADGSAVPYRVVVAGEADGARALLPDAREIAPNELELPPLSVTAMNEAVARLIAAGVPIVAISPVYSSLEREFRDAIAEGGQAADG